MKIYGVPFSVHTRKVIVTALEKKLPYENEPVIPFNPPPGWTDLSPTGKIPAFTDGDVTLCDSSVICAYLERAHPNPPIYPADTRDYIQALWFEEYADGTIFREVIHGLFFNKVIRPKILNTPGDQAAVDTILQEAVPAVFGYLEKSLAGQLPRGQAIHHRRHRGRLQPDQLPLSRLRDRPPSQARPLFRADDRAAVDCGCARRPNRASSPEWASIAPSCRRWPRDSHWQIARETNELVGALGVGWHGALAARPTPGTCAH